MTDIEVGLSDTERQIRDSVHRFARDVMRPAGEQLDRLHDPQDVIASNSILWDVFKKHREAGLADIEGTTAELSPFERARLRAITSEEMGWGDSGLAISLGVANFHKTFAMMSGRPALIDRFVRGGQDEIGCWAVTEPDHGSDSLTFTEPHFSDSAIRANCIATRDGDDYIIRGQKSGWVSNGTMATVAALFCTIDPSQGFKGGGVAVVPLDLPGVSRGKPTNKLGQRALNQGEIFFDEVRIPAEYMVVGSDAYGAVVEQILTGANASMGTIFVGVGRAALEHAVEYAKTRVQGGVPIIQHQSVKARLFKMFVQVEAARSLSRRVAHYNATNPPLIQYSIASKVNSTNTAFEVASQAIQIFGGNGLTRDFPVEKLMRDARASMIEDGCNDLLSLVGASRL
ncbi:MAG: acyl-CoA/acyl-ACP dehydrogenase [Dehalococcoidia bacterium]|nr:acyl-CoA/acyl-ACP dehydrogenase [Dehalococcoidia bacterium]MBK7126920.1 acyl-CoA/acyl-ACP dehydrogenase [Dehalococcoidia bacterium]MBK7330364.1 acyl-CoA/acyl-ACP dehydrogenase [Dehalococcoidia bacterium]MBK8558644.1 acyl-CoA/acyl-ACP dehydrogenase [Dehalococcoidia bacterium]MBK9344323.1 acyl-CoA/acyl-ACP dehydrogenase [Dehalococcoidia bacterium]